MDNDNKDTLATFVQRTRDELGMSAKGLAKKSNIDLSTIEDIESGKDLFLSATVRQKLAKALRCSLEEIIALERGYQDIKISDDIITSIKLQILNKKTDIFCPRCGAPMVVRIAKGYDLDDNLVLSPKGHCSKCVFQIKD